MVEIFIVREWISWLIVESVDENAEEMLLVYNSLSQ